MKYLYIHGFNSSKNSSTPKALSYALGVEVIALGYDSSKEYIENIQDLKKQVVDLNTDEDITVIGTSLGGFYADQLSYWFPNIVNVVMFNPATDPENQLRQYIGENISYETNEKWILTEYIVESYWLAMDTRPRTKSRVVFLGKKDDVIDPNYTYMYWNRYSKIYWFLGGHRVENFWPFVDEIKKDTNGG